MKRNLKRVLSAAISAIMLFGSLSLTSVEAIAAGSIAGGGWYETIFAELTGAGSSQQVTAVSWSGTASGSLQGDDLKYLVRDVNGKVRIDIPGITPGTYALSVTAGGQTYTKQNIEVYPYDRSGYAHWKYTEGVGAYKDDGTLKPNARVLYVTDANKDTVSVTSKDGTTVTGIGNILNSAGAHPKTDDSGKVLSNVINTNNDIIRKLAQDGTPLVVRIIGNVTAPRGLTAYDSNDYGGTEGDNGFMARMQSGKDITIEGIGVDAEINGWGIHFICQTAYKEYGKSFEVRNISFRNVPEDCVGMEGQQSGSEITAGVERCWIHHCEFNAPNISNPAESDKAGGDGACDFKRGQYFTNSYCRYYGYHKTNLVGSSDSSMQFNLTYHHNYWKGCEARGPLGRQANIHMYNNFVEGQTDYAQQTRANCYIFSEYNLFYQCKNPQQVKNGGPIKSYMDSLSGCIESMDATVVKDKTQVITSSNKYSAFDTNPELSYIPSGEYELDESIAIVKAKALSQSGVMKAEPVMDPEDVNTSMVESDRQPTASVKLPYDKALNSSYVTGKNTTVDNIIFNVAKTDSSSITVGSNSIGQDIVFNVNTAVNISITDGGGTYPVILMSDSGEAIITGTGTAYNVPAGTYFIQSSGFTPAKGDTPAKFKESKITHLKITAYDPEAPTEAEPTTQPTTQAKETNAQTTTKSGTQEPDPETTTNEQGGGNIDVDADNTYHNFTPDGLSDPEEFFGIEGTLSTDKGTMSYKGLNLTRCLKMESSTEITFNSGTGKLILVMNTTAKNSIVIDGATVKFDSIKTNADGAFEYTLTKSGAHTVKKGSGSSNMFYIEYVPDVLKGDVNKDNKVDKNDAVILLRHLSGVSTISDPAALANADCDGRSGIDIGDVIWILKHTESTSAEPDTSTTEKTTESTTEAIQTGVISSAHELKPSTLNSDAYFTKVGDFAAGDNNKIRLTGSNSLEFKVAKGANVYITAAHASSTDTVDRHITLSVKGGNEIAEKTYKMKAAATEILYASGLNAGTYVIASDNHMNVTSIRITFENIENPAQTTTAKTEKVTETTTLAPLPPDGDVTLSPVPSNVVKTVTSDNLTDFKVGISTLNNNGGTIMVDTPKISITGDSIKLSGSKQAAIVGVMQDDGTYPVIDCSGMSSGKRGITINGSNVTIQNVIVENAPDNGIIIDGGNNNTLEHVIARYNGDTGIQLSNNASGNVLRYCYSYRNVDIGTYGANADGFAPKLGAKNTTFEYCYSWDNSDDGWDSYDKTGDNTPLVEYRHSACWNNGNTDVFTGKYDYDNGAPLDKKLTTVKQMMASDSGFESNYNNKKFSTANARINGTTVSSWLSKAEGEMNGNGFKFGSGETLKDGSVTRSAYYCVAFDHKAKNFDNNNSENCKAYFSNCIAFGSKTRPNYSIPYNFQLWEKIYGWNGYASDKTNNKSVTKPSNTAELEKEIYKIRDQIVSYCYANKFPDGITFDDVFTMVK